ncbi:hypothetical protein KPL71_012011 [Citrus sinensis]|uniref:Uncharacterized protein n=1 Tax=Citrus sinensis TaxID=2711 RepID=A0ACB8L839_CITSI|nr:hypothetical protein KPL71_012011 [Citrus sinensis]
MSYGTCGASLPCMLPNWSSMSNQSSAISPLLNSPQTFCGLSLNGIPHSRGGANNSKICVLNKMPEQEADMFTAVFIVHRPYFQHPETRDFWTQDMAYEWKTYPHPYTLIHDTSVASVLKSYLMELNNVQPPATNIHHTSVGPSHTLEIVPKTQTCTPGSSSSPQGILVMEQRPDYTNVLFQDAQDPWEDFQSLLHTENSHYTVKDPDPPAKSAPKEMTNADEEAYLSSVTTPRTTTDCQNCSPDTRFKQYQHAVVGTVLTTLHAGSVLLTFYPNFNLSLEDPDLPTTLKVQIQLQGAEQTPTSKIATLHHQIVYRLQNHALDFPTPHTTSDALMILADTDTIPTIIQIPKQIQKQELLELMPLEWLTNYEHFHQNSKPVQTTEATFERRQNGQVKLSFQTPETKPVSDTSQLSYTSQEKNLPIHGFSSEGYPVSEPYHFRRRENFSFMASTSSSTPSNPVTLSSTLSLPKSCTSHTANKIENLVEYSYIPESAQISESSYPLLSPYQLYKRPSSFTRSIRTLISTPRPHPKEYIQSSHLDQCSLQATPAEQYVTLEIPSELISSWKREGYTHLHLGGIRLILTLHGRKGLPVTARLAMLDTRFKQYQDVVIDTVLTTLHAGSVLLTFYPNFNLSLQDPNLPTTLKVQVQIQGAEQISSAKIATLHHQLVYRLQNHALDLPTPKHHSDTLMLFRQLRKICPLQGLILKVTLFIQPSKTTISYGMPLVPACVTQIVPAGMIGTKTMIMQPQGKRNPKRKNLLSHEQDEPNDETVFALQNSSDSDSDQSYHCDPKPPSDPPPPPAPLPIYRKELKWIAKHCKSEIPSPLPHPIVQPLACMMFSSTSSDYSSSFPPLEPHTDSQRNVVSIPFTLRLLPPLATWSPLNLLNQSSIGKLKMPGHKMILCCISIQKLSTSVCELNRLRQRDNPLPPPPKPKPKPRPQPRPAPLHPSSLTIPGQPSPSSTPTSPLAPLLVPTQSKDKEPMNQFTAHTVTHSSTTDEQTSDSNLVVSVSPTETDTGSSTSTSDSEKSYTDITKILMAQPDQPTQGQTSHTEPYVDIPFEFEEEMPESSATNHPPSAQTNPSSQKSSNGPWFTFDDLPSHKWRDRLNEMSAWIDLQMLRTGATTQSVLREFATRFTVFEAAKRDYLNMKCCSLNAKDLDFHYKSNATRKRIAIAVQRKNGIFGNSKLQNFHPNLADLESPTGSSERNLPPPENSNESNQADVSSAREKATMPKIVPTKEKNPSDSDQSQVIFHQQLLSLDTTVPIPSIKLQILPSKFQRPIPAIGLIDTGAQRSMLNPHILPSEYWTQFEEHFKAVNGKLFTTSLITKKPIGIQIFPNCVIWTKVICSTLPNKDILLGFDILHQIKHLQIIPTGIRVKSMFKPFTDILKLYNLSETPQSYQDISTKLLSFCPESHSEFTHSNPLWKNKYFFIKLPFKLNEDINPTKATHPGMSPSDLLLAQQECSQLLAQGLIEPTSSQWACQAFYVEKHSEIVRGKKRLVIDYQPLNMFLQDDKFPLPRRQSMFTFLKNAQIFSKFDLKSGFWQLGIEPSKRSHDEHRQLLTQFYDIIQSHGIMLSTKKNTIATNNIEFLGLTLDPTKDTTEDVLWYIWCLTVLYATKLILLISPTLEHLLNPDNATSLTWTLLEWFSPIPWWRKKLQQLSEIYNLDRMPAPEAQLFTSVFIIHRPYFQHPDTKLFWTQDQVYEWFTAPHIAVIENDIQDVLHNYLCQLNHQPPPLKDISHTSLGPQHDLFMIPTPSAISKPKSTGIIIKEERPDYTDFLYQDSQDPWEDFLPLSQHLHQFPQPTMDEPGPSEPGPLTQPSKRPAQPSKVDKATQNSPKYTPKCTPRDYNCPYPPCRGPSYSDSASSIEPEDYFLYQSIDFRRRENFSFMASTSSSTPSNPVTLSSTISLPKSCGHFLWDVPEAHMCNPDCPCLDDMDVDDELEIMRRKKKKKKKSSHPITSCKSFPPQLPPDPKPPVQ